MVFPSEHRRTNGISETAVDSKLKNGDSEKAISGSNLKDEVEPTKTCELSPKLQKFVVEYAKGGPFGLSAPVVWKNVIKMTTIHIMAVIGLFLTAKAKWGTILLLPVLYVIGGLGVTAGVHRLWSHKSYKATVLLRILLMIFNCVSFQNDILEWCRDHRVHHKYAETDADPHNINRGFFFAHIGWLLMKKHPDVLIKGKSLDMSDLKKDPVVMFQHNYYYPLSLVFNVLLPIFIPCYLFGEGVLVAAFVLVYLRYVLVLQGTWLVNSAAHVWGSKPYDKHINPSDNRFVSVCAIGEGWHNYHHTFPYDYSTSEWGLRINMTTAFIDLMAALGLAYDRKTVSKEAILHVRERVGELSH